MKNSIIFDISNHNQTKQNENSNSKIKKWS